jgi:hypothetical protein
MSDDHLEDVDDDDDNTCLTQEYAIMSVAVIEQNLFLSSKPSSEVMKEYTRRIEFLKNTIDTEKMVYAYWLLIQKKVYILQ